MDATRQISSAPGHRSRDSRAARSAADAQLLRRFVSGSLAERLVRGGELSSGEREASVFFSDIRDYTRMSEPRSAGEIFNFLSTYTVIVSRVVRAWGGLPLEFHGDGTMAESPGPSNTHMRWLKPSFAPIVESTSVSGSRSTPKRRW